MSICPITGPGGQVPLVAVPDRNATLPACPLPAAANPATPARAVAAPLPPNPATLAVQFWRTIPLPVPRPNIPPGYAVTGKPAYLVTNGTLTTDRFQLATPLGELTIIARGKYLVDWGDGTAPTWTGPYTTQGLPYPNGNIAHTYDNVGPVTVTVQEVWTATWTLGGAAGTLEALHTTATIAGFPIRQIQAVITG